VSPKVDSILSPQLAREDSGPSHNVDPPLPARPVIEIQNHGQHVISSDTPIGEPTILLVSLDHPILNDADSNWNRQVISE
jgi:hypothetical protein